MLAESVLNYVAAVYGVFVGVFLPLIYLHGKLYFRQHKIGFRVLLTYLGRLAIIFILYGVVGSAFLFTVELLESAESFEQLLDSPWYLIGFSIGLFGSITLTVVGLRKGRKQDTTRKPDGHG